MYIWTQKVVWVHMCHTKWTQKVVCIHWSGVRWMTIIKEPVVIDWRGRLCRRGGGRDDANTVLMNIFNKDFQLKIKSNTITNINLLSY